MTTVQRTFLRTFYIHRNYFDPTHDTILRWINNLRTRATLMKNKSPGVHILGTPENVERIREAMLRSLHLSAHRHSAELQISNHTVWRILHAESRFRPDGKSGGKFP